MEVVERDEASEVDQCADGIYQVHRCIAERFGRQEPGWAYKYRIVNSSPGVPNVVSPVWWSERWQNPADTGLPRTLSIHPLEEVVLGFPMLTLIAPPFKDRVSCLHPTVWSFPIRTEG